MLVKDQGYTLLEVLVATALLALMAFPLAESMRIGLFAWSDSHVNAGKAERMLFAHTRLKKWLSSAYPAYFERTGDVVYPMVGDAGSLSFIAPLNPDDRGNAMYKVSLVLTEAGQIQALAKVDFAEDSRLCTDAEAICDAGTILEGVETVTFSYLNPLDGEWVDSWPAQTKNGSGLQDTLPLAVRVHVDMAEADMPWPDLVAPLAVKEWTRCQLQTSSLECSW